jgi:hypothetical protein
VTLTGRKDGMRSIIFINKSELMKNKRAIYVIGILLSVLLVCGTQLNAQKIELSPFIGYETGAQIHSTLGDLHINDGMDWGGSLDVGIGGGRYGEFSYSHMASSLHVTGSLTSYEPVNVAVDYYSLGVLQEIRPEAKATPYGLFTLGVVNYRQTSGGDVAENKMHVSLAGGVKIKASERIGLRLQARLLLPLYYAGTYFGVGTGGASAGVSGGIQGVQGDFTAALVINLR